MTATLRALSCAAITLVSATTFAGEGMWRPDALPARAKQLQRAGLKTPPQKLADLRAGPLAAVINLNGCTASFISGSGLLVTNHHCAVGAIQHNSSPKHNLLERGFTAKSQADERPAGASVHVLVTVAETDVTEAINAAMAQAKDDKDRFDRVDKTKKALIAKCERRPSSRCRVASYDGGQQYVLIRQLDLKDVRLVHNPPRSVGVFGGDVDNWMWPRHTGDWSLFRAYVGPDGKAAPYAKTNRPYQPKRWLQVSTEGVNEGDFVMVAGYPGRTSRHRLPMELKHRVQEELPRTIQTLADLVALIEEQQRGDPQAKVKLTSLRGGLANYLKYSQGLLDGLRGHRGSAEGEAVDKALKAPGRERQRAQVTRLKERLREVHLRRRRATLLRWFLRLPATARLAAELHWLSDQRGRADADRDVGYQRRDWPRLKASLQRTSARYVQSADEALFGYLLTAAAKLPENARISALDAAMRRASKRSDRGEVVWSPPKGPKVRTDAVRRLAAKLAKAPGLIKRASRSKLFKLKRPQLERRARAPIMRLMRELHPLRRRQNELRKADAGFFAAHRPAYAAALKRHAGSDYYPDANSTLRVTTGHIRGYRPREATRYSPQTTLRGIAEKARPKAPFDASKRLLQAIASTHKAIAAKRYGHPWASPQLGSVAVNFLSTCDTTGGNSGSPTLDAHGRLVGLLFDGNYESMSSDWVFNTEVTRSIHVDIRYMLWSLHTLFDGAGLLKEMGLGASTAQERKP